MIAAPETQTRPVMEKERVNMMLPLREPVMTVRKIIDKLVNLKEQAKEITADRRQVMHEAEIHGFNKKAIREALKMFEMEDEERKEFEADRTIYLESLDII